MPRVALTEVETARRALSLDPLDRRVGEIMMAAMAEGRDTSDVEVVVLSSLHDSDTVEFEPLPHHGDHAWTMNQRYVRLRELLSARSTQDLAGRADDDGDAAVEVAEVGDTL